MRCLCVGNTICQYKFLRALLNKEIIRRVTSTYVNLLVNRITYPPQHASGLQTMRQSTYTYLLSLNEVTNKNTYIHDIYVATPPFHSKMGYMRV